MEAASKDTEQSMPSKPQAAVKPLRVLVAASGTGGHLIPALHIVRALQKERPDSIIEFIGAGRPLEEKLIVGNGFKRHIVTSTGIKRKGPLGALGFVVRLPLGAWQCLALFRRFKPDVVVGVGGYVSVLPVIVAKIMRIPTWTHEAELHPGLANRLLAHFADRMSLSFAETKLKGRVKTELTGHPVRPELKGVDRDSLRPDAPKRLLVLGGSQGARGIDEAIPSVAELLHQRNMEVVHQSRPENLDLVLNSYRAAKVRASVVSFIDDMAGAYDWSDVIISRAGASSVAEISCVNRPTIFVPYPHQQGTHQTDNANELVRTNKALIVEENAPEFRRRLKESLEIILDPKTYGEMKRAPSEPRGLQAAEVIARGVLSLVDKR